MSSMFPSVTPKSLPAVSHHQLVSSPALSTFEDILCNYQSLIYHPADFTSNQEMITEDHTFSTDDQHHFIAASTSKTSHNSISNLDEMMRERVHADAGWKLALRMRTELEVVYDGYKWRKYGKKKVKSSPHPRNYFKCSSIGCNVKKRIERDPNDSTYVITTYDGVHNHDSSA